jgi:hypothetical protein
VNNEARFLFRGIRLLGRDPRVICVKETFRPYFDLIVMLGQQHEIMVGVLKLVEW